tara:strand:- start:988 stop:1431 length:444 start_codon:yes stop_codon:yes gene_type:complete
MKKTYVKSLMILGISTTTNNANELSEATQKIPALWEQYADESIYGNTLNKSNSTAIYGVYSNYISDVHGDFDVTVGVEVSKCKNAIVIENEKYLLFKKEGALPEVAFEAWQEIWDYFDNNDEYERKYAVDFEKYSKEDEIEIFISIK